LQVPLTVDPGVIAEVLLDATVVQPLPVGIPFVSVLTAKDAPLEAAQAVQLIELLGSDGDGITAGQVILTQGLFIVELHEPF
jgi:hypothetical protein